MRIGSFPFARALIQSHLSNLAERLGGYAITIDVSVNFAQDVRNELDGCADSQGEGAPNCDRRVCIVVFVNEAWSQRPWFRSSVSPLPSKHNTAEQRPL